MKLAGTIRVPGDKSITHRLILLAAMARGTSSIRGALTSLDARSTARVVRQLGSIVSPLRPGRVTTISGKGRLEPPEDVLHCGNSGTTTRLMLGLLSAHHFSATLTGDHSLRRRPMRRVTSPLSTMGARFTEHNGDGLPLTVAGADLRPLRYEMPVSSAQIKSALLLAGLAARVEIALHEPGGKSRDHTERLLRAFGYQVEEAESWLNFKPTGEVQPFEIEVPGDPSSAAFLVGAGVLAEGGELRIAGVGINPTRTGFMRVLQRMGATVDIDNRSDRFGEPVGDLIVRPAQLRSTEISAGEIPGLIDEIPLLAVLASRAAGTTIFRQVGELRIKESDRLVLLAENLRAIGGEAEVQGDDLLVEGSDAAPRGRALTAGDHRLAMAFGVLGTVPGARVSVDDMACSAVSFPQFPDALEAIRTQGGT